MNLTPHDVIIIVSPSGETMTVPRSGTVARCATVSKSAGMHAGVTLSTVAFGAVEGLPAPVMGRVLIVSALVRSALPGRLDLASPGDLVRDAAGAVVGCRGLVVNS